MLLHLTYIIASLVLLYFGASFLVAGAGGLAVRVGVPVIVVGLTVVAYGTSAPELLVSVQAALDGKGGIAAGNVVGSNIFNICVILGLAAAVKPVLARTRMVRADVPIMLLVSLIGMLVLLDGFVSRMEGIFLVIASLGYTAGNYLMGRRSTAEEISEVAAETPPVRSWGIMTLQLLGGLVLLVIGARLLVSGSVGVAQSWGVSEAIIGLTIIAAGTSMPELATSVVAARKGESDIALGNVVGSNIFNILLILGLTAIIQPFSAQGVTHVDLWMMLGAAILLWPIVATGRSINRIEGILLLIAYVGYLWFIWPE